MCTKQNDYYSQCLSSSTVGGVQRATAEKWGACSAQTSCPTGWECEARGAFQQCVPSKQLLAAFSASRPGAEATAAFVKTGATVFGRSLPKA